MTDANAAPPARSEITLLGVAIDAVTQREAVAEIRDAMHAGRGGWVVTPNLDQLRLVRRRPELGTFTRQADLVLADGMPLVWASRLQRTPLPERVAGSDLVWSLAETAAAEGLSLFLLGGDEGVADRAAAVLAARYPGLRIAGTHCPPFGFERDEAEIARIAGIVGAAGPSLVYVGLGFPKQEQLIERLRETLPDAWYLGIGISLSFISGDVARAPAWMHSLGLEWLYRTFREPRRLFRRYFVDGLPFAAVLFAHAALAGARRGLARSDA